MTALKDRMTREIAEINAYLIRTGAKTKLRPQLKKNGNYSAFSIIWRKIIYMDWKKRRAIAKYIKKGRSYQVPKARLLEKKLGIYVIAIHRQDICGQKAGIIWTTRHIRQNLLKKFCLFICRI